MAADAIRRVTNCAATEIQTNLAAIDETSERFSSLALGIEKIQQIDEESLRSLGQNRAEVARMTAEVGQRVEDGGRFLDDVIGDRIPDVASEEPRSEGLE